MPVHQSAAWPIRLAVYYGKGGVGKSTTTLLLSLLLAKQGHRVLAVDLDPECGTSRDFLGRQLAGVPHNLRSFLSEPLPVPPPVIPSGIENLDVLPSVPDEQRFFRLFPEHSTKLADGLALLPPRYDWLLMDVPNQFDNLAQLGLLACDCVILPVELTADCVERLDTALRTVAEARAGNPALNVLGVLALGSAPRSGRPLGLSAKEHLVYRQYEAALALHGIQLFQTIMFRSSTTVEEARSNADERYLHWRARRRFHQFLAEVHFRIKSLRLIPSPPAHGRHIDAGRTPAKAERRAA